MASSWPLLVEFDCPEPRVELGRLVASGDGTSWDEGASDTTVFFDPATGTAMLCPLPLTPAWETTFTGDYARFNKAAYTLTTPSKWVENNVRASGDIFLEANGVTEVATVTSASPANQPVHVEAYIAGIKSGTKQVVLECGWNRGGSDEVTVKLRGNGEIEVWYAGSLSESYSRPSGVRQAGRSAKKTASPRGEFVALTLIPCRRRELLIIDSFGGVVRHTFTHLDSSGLTNVITPAGSFYWYAPVGKASVACAPCRFEASGNIYSPPITLRYPPPTGTTFADTHASDRIGPSTATIAQTYSLVQSDGSAYTPDGIIDTVRVKVALTGDGDGTYGVYGADLYCDPTTTTTVDDPVDVTCALESLSLSVDENGRVKVTLSARRKNLTDAGVDRPQIIANRPFRIAITDGATPTPFETDIVRGTLGPPSIEYFDADDTADHDYSLLTFEGEDRSGLLDRFTLQDAYPYDGLNLITGAVEDLLAIGGYTSADWDLSSTPLELPYSPDASMGKWSLLPERGDTVGKWLDKLREEFAATWIVGWMPTVAGYKYRWIDPGDMSATPIVTLYQSVAAAQTAGVSATLRPKRVVRRLSSHYERPEANQVQVVGQDPATGLLIPSVWNDTASQTPDTAVASRPENWLGTVESVIYTDPALTTLTAVGDAGVILAQRLMPGRVLAEWESDLLVDSVTDVPLWLGDVVRIMEPDGTTVKGDYRIVSIPQIEFIHEPDAATIHVRRARYVGWLLTTQSLDFSDPQNSGLLAALV